MSEPTIKFNETVVAVYRPHPVIYPWHCYNARTGEFIEARTAQQMARFGPYHELPTVRPDEGNVWRQGTRVVFTGPVLIGTVQRSYDGVDEPAVPVLWDGDEWPTPCEPALLRVAAEQEKVFSASGQPTDDPAPPTMRTMHVTTSREIPDGHTGQRVRYQFEDNAWEGWLISYGTVDEVEEAYVQRDDGQPWVVLRENVVEIEQPETVGPLARERR